MKELSIEQKAKAYDEALKRAREWSETKNGYYMPKELCEDIFPELKESEDERIRKEIIETFKNLGDGKIPVDINYADIFTWLEKQGEYSIYNIPSREVILAIWELGNEWKELTTGSILEHGTQLDYIQKHWQESTYYLTVKQGEQESTDKHEPKFKVYDWCIDNEDDIIFQIVKVLDNTYTYRTNEGKEYSCTHYSLENEARLWTIQDAKDGDVLATPNYIYIFNSIDKETETVAFYCLIKKSDKHFSFGDYRIHDEILNSTPATKKQYDILIKAMTDAGYTFNFEKKELKKIKQKSQRIVSAEAKEALYDKTTLSEEDDDMINTIEGWLDTLCEYMYDSSSENIPYVESCINWLESLRLQNRWKPSDEQIEALGVATDICSIPEKQYDELNKLYHELKKLKGE